MTSSSTPRRTATHVARRAKAIGATVAALLALVGVAVLSLGSAGALTQASDGRLHVFATTSQIADVVHTLEPEAAVFTLVGPGGDPHTYQPSTRQIHRMHTADLVLWNGLFLEAHMVDALSGQGQRQLAVADTIPRFDLIPLAEAHAAGSAATEGDVNKRGLAPGNEGPLYDPHVWNSPVLWQRAVTAVAERLAELRPERADAYRSAAAGYSRALVDAADRARADIAQIPPQDRVVVTGHDAFSYLGRDLGITVHATDFVAADAQISATQLSDLAGLIRDRGVHTIFLDNQSNPQAIASLQQAVAARGGRVEIAPEPLYADSLAATPSADTMLGAYEHNVSAIVAALNQNGANR